MKFKSLFLSIFFIFGFTIFSCESSCDPVPFHFEIKGIESVNYKSTNSTLYQRYIIDDDRIVDWSDIVTLFEFQSNYIAASEANFGSTLLATSCLEPGYKGDLVGVDAVIVRTFHEYNENYSAGSIIDEIVLASRGFPNNTERIDGYQKLNEYIIENSNGIREEFLAIKLAEAPSNQTPFALDITYRLNNGEVFKHRTQDINIRN